MRRNARLHPRGFLSASLAWMAALGVLALLSPVSDALAQQTGAISGRVADEQGNAISGAEIVIDAIRKGALTNASGNYVIADVPAGSHTVRVRFIGYRPQTVE
ncbi:MAG: carboxypeptidase-like regulatory domain-containing protein, partial [Gemmatimonadota bacterium]